MLRIRRREMSGVDVLKVNVFALVCVAAWPAFAFDRGPAPDDDIVDQEPSTADWMSELYDARPDIRVIETILPGTHQSGTSGMGRHSRFAEGTDWYLASVPSRFVRPWAQCQDQDVYQQLQDGIRFLDLRVTPWGEGWMTFHAVTSSDLEEIIDDIGAFAQEHPREIVIVDFRELDASDPTELADFLRGHGEFGPRVAPANQFDATSTYGELWRADKNVIPLFQRNEVVPSSIHVGPSDWVWPRRISSPWPNSSDPNEVSQYLRERIPYRPRNIFYVSQAIVTPDARVVTLGWWRGVRSLRDMATKWMNPELDSLLPDLNQLALDHGRYLNIVIADYYDQSSLVEQCLSLNQENLDVGEL